MSGSAIKPENRSTQLARLLQGRALEVYQRLADSDVTSYEKLKEGFLKRLKLSEVGYRSRFKKSRRENGETPEQFVEQIRKYLRKWREIVNFEETYEGLEDLIVRDQYFLTCPKDLQTFLKEQDQLDLKQMTEKSTNYIEAHGLNRDDYSSHKRDKVRETTDDRKGTNASVTNKFISSESKRPMRSFVCDKVDHKSVDCRARTQPNTIVRSEWGIRCYTCSAFGHKAVDCPESKKGGVRELPL